MEENQKSPFQFAIMPGIYLGIVLIVVSLVFFLLDVAYDSPIMYLSYLVMAAGLFYAMITYRDKSLGGLISYGTAFGVGFWTLLIATILGTIYGYFYVTMIHPGLAEEILINSEEAILDSNPNMSDEQLEQALSFTEMFTTPIMMTVWGLVGNLFFGTIITLLIAIFVKREDKSLA